MEDTENEVVSESVVSEISLQYNGVKINFWQSKYWFHINSDNMYKMAVSIGTCIHYHFLHSQKIKLQIPV